MERTEKSPRNRERGRGFIFITTFDDHDDDYGDEMDGGFLERNLLKT